MIFMCISLVIMAGIARVYMAGGLDGILGTGSGSENFRLKAPKNVEAVTTDRDVQVYKWRDKNGVMHFGEVPPDSDIAAEKIELKANQNVMNAPENLSFQGLLGALINSHSQVSEQLPQFCVWGTGCRLKFAQRLGTTR